jgi:hypothetical protein
VPAGGYQAPRKPAPVSGPGALSERTDGAPGQAIRDLPNPGYGEQKEFTDLQKQAKMSQASSMPRVTRLDAPSERPDEPITEGNSMGPGRGPEAYGIQNTMRDKSRQEISSVASALPLLEQAANGPNMPPSFVRFVRYLRDNA